MIDIDLTENLQDLDGGPVFRDGRPVSIGRLVAEALLNGGKGDPLKLYDWAMTLAKTGRITLDTSDEEIFKGHIKDSPSITNLVKGQALTAINTQKGKG